jgi:hypothetical protein
MTDVVLAIIFGLAIGAFIGYLIGHQKPPEQKTNVGSLVTLVSTIGSLV